MIHEVVMPVPCLGGDVCPRCHAAARAGAAFCPRCGGPAAAAGTWKVRNGGRTYQMAGLLAAGAVADVYRCRPGDAPAVAVVLKLARDPRCNDLLANEAAVLRRLAAAPGAARFEPFLPRPVDSFLVDREGRRANVLAVHERVDSVDELYTLDEVRAARPTGLDARDVAWIWRRLLYVLGFARSAGVAHGAVLPSHVLVEPKTHKLLLVDWCFAAAGTRAPPPPPRMPAEFAGPRSAWYRREGAARRPPTPALDVALGARCMIELLGGDPVEGAAPADAGAAIASYFRRCMAAERNPGAWRLLADFDRLIEILWGPRTFRELKMPARPGRPRPR